MSRYSKFMGGKKQRPNIETFRQEVDGSFQCDKCMSIADRAYYVADSNLLTYKCAECGFLNNLKVNW